MRPEDERVYLVNGVWNRSCISARRGERTGESVIRDMRRLGTGVLGEAIDAGGLGVRGIRGKAIVDRPAERSRG
jgi:hypothetical protein